MAQEWDEIWRMQVILAENWLLFAGEKIINSKDSIARVVVLESLLLPTATAAY